jgi:hypothetical protein
MKGRRGGGEGSYVLYSACIVGVISVWSAVSWENEENKQIDISFLIGCWSTCRQANKYGEVASSPFCIHISIYPITDLLSAQYVYH